MNYLFLFAPALLPLCFGGKFSGKESFMAMGGHHQLRLTNRSRSEMPKNKISEIREWARLMAN